MIQRIEDSDLTLTASKIYLCANLLIAAGAIIAIIGLIGIFGSVKENEYVLLLVSFIFCLVPLIIKLNLLFFEIQYSALLVGTFAMYMTCAGWGFYSLDYVNAFI